MDIRFIENEADLTIVLPPMEEELSKNELEAASGGKEDISLCAVGDVCGVIDYS